MAQIFLAPHSPTSVQLAETQESFLSHTRNPKEVETNFRFTSPDLSH